ncbi:chemokine (C-C motif) receptor 12a [Osmerus eperlanus]|uniref:chemokine (C-C motif) receptor 12a n=1 Tax=Osmerus eperlanus TaxID=29151 RepID=UPI002E0F883A
MEYDDEKYNLFLELYNESSNESSTYVTDELVTLCQTVDVNKFGATFMPLFYHINFLLSILGNGLVLCIIYKYEKLNTVTNIFLLNLVFSDILFACSLPFWATYYSTEWIFGRALCKIVGSMFSIGFYSSILFLTLMTFDRYLAVVHAITAAKSRRKLYACSLSAAVWFISILAGLKELVLYDVRKDHSLGYMCEEMGSSKAVMTKWKLFGYYQQFLIFFLLPLLMVLYCYIRITVRIMSTRMKEKCRAVKLVFVIIFTFFICWTPYNVVILLRAFHISRDPDICFEALNYALYVTRNVAYFYCCVSPVFYTFVGKKFQSHFRKLVSKRIPCLKTTLLTSQSSRTTSQRSPYTNCDY